MPYIVPILSESINPHTIPILSGPARAQPIFLPILGPPPTSCAPRAACHPSAPRVVKLAFIIAQKRSNIARKQQENVKKWARNAQESSFLYAFTAFFRDFAANGGGVARPRGKNERCLTIFGSLSRGPNLPIYCQYLARIQPIPNINP
jgi:hypothetical protein